MEVLRVTSSARLEERPHSSVYFKTQRHSTQPGFQQTTKNGTGRGGRACSRPERRGGRIGPRRTGERPERPSRPPAAEPLRRLPKPRSPARPPRQTHALRKRRLSPGHHPPPRAVPPAGAGYDAARATRAAAAAATHLGRGAGGSGWPRLSRRAAATAPAPPAPRPAARPRSPVPRPEASRAPAVTQRPRACTEATAIGREEPQGAGLPGRTLRQRISASRPPARGPAVAAALVRPALRDPPRPRAVSAAGSPRTTEALADMSARPEPRCLRGPHLSRHSDSPLTFGGATGERPRLPHGPSRGALRGFRAGLTGEPRGQRRPLPGNADRAAGAARQTWGSRRGGRKVPRGRSFPTAPG